MRIVDSSATLGAYVHDVNLAHLSDARWDELHGVFLDKAVLVFPEASLTTQQQERFSERFGQLEILTGNPLIKSLYVCNVDTEGNVLPLDDDNFRIVRGNEYWHTDSSYMPIAAKVSCLSALTLPKGRRTDRMDRHARCLPSFGPSNQRSHFGAFGLSLVLSITRVTGPDSGYWFTLWFS